MLLTVWPRNCVWRNFAGPSSNLVAGATDCASLFKSQEAPPGALSYAMALSRRTMDFAEGSSSPICLSAIRPICRATCREQKRIDEIAKLQYTSVYLDSLYIDFDASGAKFCYARERGKSDRFSYHP